MYSFKISNLITQTYITKENKITTEMQHLVTTLTDHTWVLGTTGILTAYPGTLDTLNSSVYFLLSCFFKYFFVVDFLFIRGERGSLIIDHVFNLRSRKLPVSDKGKGRTPYSARVGSYGTRAISVTRNNVQRHAE